MGDLAQDARRMNLPPPDLPPPSVPPAPDPAKVTVVVNPPPQRDETNPYSPPVAEVQLQPKVKADVYEASGSLGALVKEAFAYPLRSGGVGTMIIGTVVLMIIGVAAYAPLIGIAVVVGGWAYIGAFYLDIINSTLNGKDEAPPWPELSSLWDDVVIPGVQMVAIILISGALQFAAVLASGADAFDDPQYWLGALVKWLYFPMATLAVVCNGSVWAVLPHRVLPALVRCLPGYLVCAAAFAGAEILKTLLFSAVGMIPFLGWLLPWVVFMYVMLVQARLTGLIYLRYRERMPW